MLFDGPRIKLPVATLLATGSQTRRRMDLDRWLSLRWDWVRPRAVPLLAALVGLMLSLGAVKYTSKLSYTPDLARPSSVRAVHSAPAGSETESAPDRAQQPRVYRGSWCGTHR
jgi:hypothetical protein